MTLIFLHGSGCTNKVWAQQVAYFKGSIALNLPGHPDGEALSGINAMAQWLLNVLQEYDLSNVVLVGHSMGSAVALQAALHDASRLSGLVLIGSGARLKVMPQFLSGLAQVAEKSDSFPEYLLTPNQGIPEPLRADINEAIVNNGAAVMLTDFIACNNFDIMDKVDSISLPIQLIVGSEDVMTPVKYSQYLQAQLPNATLNIVDGGTHMVFAEQAVSVNKCIDYFVNSL